MARALARVGFAVLLVLLLLAGIGCGSSESPTLRLVFHSDRDGDDDIYLMEGDDRGVRRLTNAPGRDYEAASSRDGRTLVFVSERADGPGGQLYLMSADGSGVRRLTVSSGGDARVVDDHPQWSPDGLTVTFQRTTIPAEGQPDADLWLIDIETRDEIQLTEMSDVWDSTPSFAANGDSILFESSRDGDFDLYRLDLETMEVVQLTDEAGRDVEASESPNGRAIAFASERDGDFEIYVMDAAGRNVRQLTENDSDDRCPHWSPDGRWLSFYSERDGNPEIYVMEPDGTGQRRLTHNPARDEAPNWVIVRP